MLVDGDKPGAALPGVRSRGVTRLRQVALAISLSALTGALAVFLTGGFRFRIGSFRISATSPRNPLMLAGVSAVAAWVLATPAERRRAAPAAWAYVRGDRGPLGVAHKHAARLVHLAAAAVAVLTVAFGLSRGSFIAAGSDEYGYLSQADLWAEGSLIVEQPFAANMTWPNAAQTLAPLGYRPYRPAAHGTHIVPIYSPGLPIMMAAFKRVAGPRAVFYVVPLLGGLAVWATYLLGVRFADRVVGLCAAALLATSPAFLSELLAPTSDAPVTAWWTLAFALLAVERRGTTLGAGLAAGMAILTRPNLVPLASVPALLLVWRAVGRRRVDPDRSASALLGFVTNGSFRRLLLFGLGSIPFCILVAIINAWLYGSPLASGYGPLNTLYSWSHLWPNLGRYPRWVVESQTPIVLLALAAPIVASRATPTGESAREARALAVTWLCFVAAVFLSYLFYIPFDHAGYLRFILPAYPPVFVLTSFVLIAMLRRLAGGAHGAATAVVIALLAWHGLDSAVNRGLLIAWRVEQRYATVGDYVAARLPQRAALLSMQHSGSLRYYSGRLTVRYDLITPTDLDSVVHELRRLGYHPYFVLDNAEESYFRQQFAGHSAWGALDWIAIALFHSDTVRIYDPADRQAGRPDLHRIPDVVQ